MIEITWLGTAGFYIKSDKDDNILLDPFYPENPNMANVKKLIQECADKSQAIFLSHGHFDHAKSVLDLANTRDLLIFCSKNTARNLNNQGLTREKLRIIKEGISIQLGKLIIEPYKSKHARIDLILIIRKIWQKRKDIHSIAEILSYLKDFPKGKVYSYKIMDVKENSAEESCIIHFWGSAGITRKECKLLHSTNFNALLLPLYGNTWVIRHSLRIIKSLNPQIVIPHHTDDSFPPLSEEVNLQPFIEKMGRDFPNIKTIILREGEKYSIIH